MLRCAQAEQPLAVTRVDRDGRVVGASDADLVIVGAGPKLHGIRERPLGRLVGERGLSHRAGHNDALAPGPVEGRAGHHGQRGKPADQLRLAAAAGHRQRRGRDAGTERAGQETPLERLNVEPAGRYRRRDSVHADETSTPSKGPGWPPNLAHLAERQATASVGRGSRLPSGVPFAVNATGFDQLGEVNTDPSDFPQRDERLVEHRRHLAVLQLGRVLV